MSQNYLVNICLAEIPELEMQAKVISLEMHARARGRGTNEIFCKIKWKRNHLRNMHRKIPGFGARRKKDRLELAVPFIRR